MLRRLPPTEVAVNHVVGFLVAPLRLVSRSVALLAAALLLLGAWGLTLFMQTAQVERDALSGLTVSANIRRSRGRCPAGTLLRHDQRLPRGGFPGSRQGGAYRAPGAVAECHAAGRCDVHGGCHRPVAGGLHHGSAADADVANADWFRNAFADNAMPLALHRDDAWLHDGPATVLTRVVRDSTGKAVGLVGAVLQIEDLTRLVGHTWLAPGVSIEFRGVGGSAILATKEAEPLHAVPPRTDASKLGEWFMSVVNRLLGAPKQLAVSAPLRTVDATVVARMDTDIALRSHWLGTRAIGILGAYLLAVWVTCIALAVSVGPTEAQTVPIPAGFGADWQLDLDKRGIVVAAFGYTPDRLREAAGMSLLPRSASTSPTTWHAASAEALEAHPGLTASRCRSRPRTARSGSTGSASIHSQTAISSAPAAT